MIHVNISSLPRRLNELTNTLATLNFYSDVIALTETKITAKVNSYFNPYIENYTFYQSQSNTSSGSVGIFVKNSLVVNLRNDLDISFPGLFETVWFDI